jgi:hypothetical protein
MLGYDDLLVVGYMMREFAVGFDEIWMGSWGCVKSWFKWSLVHANYTCVWLMWHSQFIVADWICNYMLWC